MAKRRVFKKQVLHIETWGLTAFCEVQAGDWKKECEAIDSYDYHKYEKWADDEHWGHQTLGTCDVHNVRFVVKLPKFSDSQGIVSFCAGLAHSTIVLANSQNVSTPLVSRLAGVIWNNLQTEDIDIEDEPKEQEGKV